MPDRLINTTATIADCIMRGSVYGACLSLLGMPADALLLGAMSAGIAHGLRGPTTRRVGWSRIGIGTLLAGAGAPVAVAAMVLFVDFGNSANHIRPVAQALAAIVIGSAWPNLSTTLLTGLSGLIDKFTGGEK